MNRAVRVLLAWVMVLAVPMQGLAASAKVLCGPTHERMMRALVLETSAVAPGHSGHAVHDAAGAGHGHDHGMHEHMRDGDAGVPDAGAGLESGGTDGLSPHHDKFSCSACAACCAALALPAGFAPPEVVTAVHWVHPSPATPVASHLPDGLDPPPRSALA